MMAPPDNVCYDTSTPPLLLQEISLILDVDTFVESVVEEGMLGKLVWDQFLLAVQNDTLAKVS